MFHGYPSLGGEDPFSNRYQNIAGTLPAPLALGSEYRGWNGAVFRYIKASSAIALGEGCELDALTNLATFAGITVTDHQRIGGLTGLTAGAHVGKLLYINTGTAANACRTIIANGTNFIVVDRPYVTDPGATSNFDAIPTWHVNAADAAIDKIVGISSVSAITSGNFGWIQTSGLCEHILAGTGGVTVNLQFRYVTDGVTNVAATDNDTMMTLGTSLATASAAETFPGFLYGCMAI